MEYTDSNLFLSYQAGDTFLALDAPFSAHIAPDSSTVWDGEKGIKIVYVLKFQIEEQTGMTFVKAGAVFQQFLDVSAHCTLLHILAALMSPKLAKFAGQIAHLQAAACPSPSMASTDNPWESIKDH